jgi:hypothetical protein
MSRIALLAPVAALALLSACAGTPRPAAPVQPAPPATVEVATVLLPVRLAGPVDPDGPAPLMELVLDTAHGPQAGFTQVPAAAASATDDASGRDYLFRLPLPPGRYRLASLQLREGSRRRPLALGLPFEVDSPAPRYIGRLIVRPATDGTLALETAWQPHEDIARYRSLATFTLRSQGVQLQPVVARGPAASPGSAASAASAATATSVPATTAPPPRADPMDTVLAGASSALRQAFQRYRTLKPPKAFAVSDDGRWSSAHGAGDAPVRSLVDCAHQGARCRLLAIDDRLVVQGAR